MPRMLFMTVSALLLSATTFAAPKALSTITCIVHEKEDSKTINVKVEFIIQDLGKKSAVLVQHPKMNEEYGPILINPREASGHFTLMSVLNDQGGDLRVGDDRIRLFGDGDGYSFVDLVLYKNSGYKNGYVRVSGDGGQMYQKLACSVK